jgi:spore germination protein KC
MIRKTALICLFVALLFIGAGCWNRRELNDLAIIVGMAIDKSGEQYVINVQVVDPGQVAARKTADSRSPVSVYEMKGATVSEALRRMTIVLPRKPYLSHLRIVAISESLAREGIGEALDYLSRDNELRSDFPIIIAKGGSAKDTLKILTTLEKIPANKLFDALEMSEKEWAPTMIITLDELMKDLTSEGKNPVITGIATSGDLETAQTTQNVERMKPPNRLQYIGLAVFRKDKFLGWLNENESKGYNYILNHVQRTLGTLTCPGGGKLSSEVIRSKAEIKGKVENGVPRIDVRLRSENNVEEVQCRIDLTKTETIDELEKIVNQRVEEVVKDAIEAAQKKYKADIFGFGEVIRRSDPKAWKTLKQDWDKRFADLDVHVLSDAKIRRLGTVSNSFLENMKKKE